jgi:alkylhydroperoxidase family enzyme
MARVRPLELDEAPPESRTELDNQVARGQRATNMKRTLAHSPVALAALMTWYPLRDAVAAFLGDRAAVLFAHAVSSQTDCLICSTFFRRLLTESGDNPDAPMLGERERTLVDFGRQLARDANGVSDELYARLTAFLTPDQIVTLTAFGGLMIATNVFNNALRVDLDEYLWPYRKGGAAAGRP